MKFEYQPPFRFGDLIGGMDRTLVRQLLGSEFVEFRKTPMADNTTDAFNKLALHAYYDSDNKLKGVEIFKRSQVSVGDIELLNLNLLFVTDKLIKSGISGYLDAVGWISSDESLRLYSPNCDEDVNQPVEAVYIVLPRATIDQREAS